MWIYNRGASDVDIEPTSIAKEPIKKSYLAPLSSISPQ
jgi:hypothetical protein